MTRNGRAGSIPAAGTTKIQGKAMSLWKILLILVIILIIFGAGKLPKVMGDLGRGVRSFKKGLEDEENPKQKSKKKKVPPKKKQAKKA